ncbi:decarboxylating 6-phosphogluconate dehydrogenase [Patescibacteria group bacterium]|nr:decarboxylating 6-phosphogluconate dehydrogenase [Patescibacteria group bacterium]
MKIGYIGLGKMGLGMVSRLREKSFDIVAFDPSEESLKEAQKAGAEAAASAADVVSKLEHPRLVWLMVPHQVVDSVLDEIVPQLEKGDTIVDGGNSNFKKTINRAEKVEEKGIHYLDAGVSGGPGGARSGACVMVGGDADTYSTYEDLFKAIADTNAYGHFGASGAGHFVKMVHNGIEYGMMQAIGEGFEILKKSEYTLNLTKVADLYNHKSVIESRLVGWLKQGYDEYGEDLEAISGKVSHSGEGLWTVETAKEMGIPVPIIEGSLKFREESQENPSYTGQVVSALRNQFGGHEVKKKKE